MFNREMHKHMVENRQIRSFNCTLYNVKGFKNALTPFDRKRFWLTNNISRGFGYPKENTDKDVGESSSNSHKEGEIRQKTTEGSNISDKSSRKKQVKRKNISLDDVIGQTEVELNARKLKKVRKDFFD